MENYIDPNVPCPSPDSVHPDAVIVAGQTHTGRACRIVDNTRSIPKEDLAEVLNSLIAERRFGVAALSPHGGQTLAIGRPNTTHIQFGDDLYRLMLFPYEAHIERF
ncbi:MAG: hypothetical protein ACYDEV_05585 [Acidiferrobacter sp.]